MNHFKSGSFYEYPFSFTIFHLPQQHIQNMNASSNILLKRIFELTMYVQKSICLIKSCIGYFQYLLYTNSSVGQLKAIFYPDFQMFTVRMLITSNMNTILASHIHPFCSFIFLKIKPNPTVFYEPTQILVLQSFP